MKKSFIELEFVVGEDIQQRLQCISLSGNINWSNNENFMKLLSEQHFFLLVTPGAG